MPSSHAVLAVLAVVVVVGTARAQPGGTPIRDTAGQQGEYVIVPGAEALLSDVLGKGQPLPGGCALTNGQIERTSVVATYTCSGAEVVLQLLHPAMARQSGVATQRFAVTVKSGEPPAGLVDNVAERIRTRESEFEWTRRDPRPSEIKRWVPRATAGAVVAVLLFWVVRRFAARRRSG